MKTETEPAGQAQGNAVVEHERDTDFDSSSRGCTLLHAVATTRESDGVEVIQLRKENGEVTHEVVVTKPVRQGGAWAGRVWMSEDFNDPMPELEQYF